MQRECTQGAPALGGQPAPSRRSTSSLRASLRVSVLHRGRRSWVSSCSHGAGKSTTLRIVCGLSHRHMAVGRSGSKPSPGHARPHDNGSSPGGVRRPRPRRAPAPDLGSDTLHGRGRRGRRDASCAAWRPAMFPGFVEVLPHAGPAFTRIRRLRSRTRTSDTTDGIQVSASAPAILSTSPLRWPRLLCRARVSKDRRGAHYFCVRIEDRVAPPIFIPALSRRAGWRTTSTCLNAHAISLRRPP